MDEVYRSPWFDLEGYLACTVKYSSGTRRTILQHREIIEKHVGRKLSSDELVHHKDEDKRNNVVDNLEIMSRGSHLNHHRNEPIFLIKVCPVCRIEFEISMRQFHNNQGKYSKKGPFCGKRCAGRDSRREQIAHGQVNLRK